MPEIQMIFEVVGDRPFPRLPRDDGGNPRQTDGSRFLTIRQAATRFGLTESQLRDIYLATFEELLPAEDAALLIAGPAAAQAQLLDEDEEISGAGELISRAKSDLLRAVVYPHLEQKEYEFFLEVCRRRRLSPWTKHLVAEVRRDLTDGHRVVILITTIQALRLIADRSERYSGQTAPQWCGPDGKWLDVWISQAPPAAARVGILRKGFDQPCWGVVTWSSFAQYVEGKSGRELSPFWAERPDHQLAKCAEASGHRKAFPEECADLYLREEMMPEAIRPRRTDPSEDESEGPPQSKAELVSALKGMGLREQWQRDKAMRVASTRYPDLIDDEPLRFYAKVVEIVQADPDGFGVSLQASA